MKQRRRSDSSFCCHARDRQSRRGIAPWLLPAPPGHRQQCTAEDEREQGDRRERAGLAAGVGQVLVGQFLET